MRSPRISAETQPPTRAPSPQLRTQYGLDRPIVVRYGDWIAGAATLDFGVSVANRQPVTDLIGLRLKRTAIVLLISLAIIFPLALVVGTVSALRRDTALDSGLQVTMLSLASLPSFVVGISLIVLFSFVWHLLPAVALDLSPQGPRATDRNARPRLDAVHGADGARRRVQALDSEYVQMARLKGLSEQRVVRSHVLPNSLVPAIQAFALTAAGMPAGIVIVEYLFGFQGIGVFLIDSVRSRDAPTVEAVTLILVAVYIVANLLSDIFTILLTPRLRTEATG